MGHSTSWPQRPMSIHSRRSRPRSERSNRNGDRFVAAVAAGGWLDALVGALRQRDAMLKTLEARRIDLRSARRPAPASDRGTVHREMLALARDWRRVLLGGPIEARPIL